MDNNKTNEITLLPEGSNTTDQSVDVEVGDIADIDAKTAATQAQQILKSFDPFAISPDALVNPDPWRPIQKLVPLLEETGVLSDPYGPALNSDEELLSLDMVESSGLGVEADSKATENSSVKLKIPTW